MATTTVGAIILDDKNNILLTKRNIPPFKDMWCLPGGHIDKFETAKTAVIREVKEETGLDFEPTFFKYFDEIIPDLDIHHLVLIYTGKAIGEFNPDENEVKEIGWFTIESALQLDLAFDHGRIIKEFSSR
jgi:8-oxo-dGTP diphosphatase